MLAQGDAADEFFGKGMGSRVRSILGLDASLEEMSGAGGAVAGYARRSRKEKKEKIKRSNTHHTMSYTYIKKF